ncbi:MAG: LamG domain-containing protein [Planctomycetota bacterium]
MMRGIKILVVLALLVLNVPVFGSDASLVAHWAFDEGGGTIAYDSAGGNDGTIYGAEYATGQVGGALEFDGVDDYVDVGNDPSLKPSLPVTVSAWIKLSGSGKLQRVVSTGEQVPTYYGVWLELLSTDRVHIGFGDGTGSASQAYRRSKFGASVLDTGRWYHVVGVMRGATDMDVYVDGVDDGGNYNGSGGSLAYSDANSAIGYDDAPRYHFDGLIDDVRIYDRALSAEEVEELYLEGLGDLERAVMRVENALDEKEVALEAVDAAIVEEADAYEALEELLDSKDYGDLKKGDVVKAKQGIHSAMQQQEQSADGLTRSIDKLEDVLLSLGWEPEPEPNLVAHWKLDEGEGTTAYDSAGNNNGTLNDAPNWTTGQVDGALEFDGLNDHVSIPNNAVTTTEFTLSAWANPYGPGGGEMEQNVIFCQRDNTSGSNHCLIFLSTEVYYNLPYASARVKSSSGPRQDLEVPMKDYNEWHHYTLTVDSSDLIFYIDGAEVVRTTNAQSGGYVTSIDQVYIAKHWYAGRTEGLFNGAIDEVRVYDRALSAVEVQQLYQDGL